MRRGAARERQFGLGLAAVAVVATEGRGDRPSRELSVHSSMPARAGPARLWCSDPGRTAPDGAGHRPELPKPDRPLVRQQRRGCRASRVRARDQPLVGAPVSRCCHPHTAAAGTARYPPPAPSAVRAQVPRRTVQPHVDSAGSQQALRGAKGGRAVGPLTRFCFALPSSVHRALRSDMQIASLNSLLPALPPFSPQHALCMPLVSRSLSQG